MGYDYTTERLGIFTEDGLKMLLKLKDRIRLLCQSAGACTIGKVIDGTCGDSWAMLACIDYLVEQKFIVKISTGGMTQDDVLTLKTT